MKVPKIPDKVVYPVENPDLDSVAYDYIESEVGRYNLVDNWNYHKNVPDIEIKIQRWLEYFDYSDHVTPKEVIEFIDRFIEKVHRGQRYL